MPSATSHSPALSDLLLIGGGAAGLLLAGELRRLGLGVTVVDAQGCAGLEASFGLFADELPAWMQPAVAARWEAVRFASEAGEHRLPCAYARLDSDMLHALLRERASGAHIETGRVRGIARQGEGFAVRLDDGRTLRARRVVDTSGHRPARLSQVALGGTLTGAHGLVEPLLMDYSGPAQGTFLYALPLREDRLFVEETALITAAPPSWAELERRLRTRLAARGLHGALAVHERCRIAMDPALPAREGAVLAFGAAAAMVHPATGYQLGASAALAPALAEALAATLDRSPGEAAARCWPLIWPREAERVRALRLFGARLVAELDHADQAAFFDAFFRLPPALARAYLAPDTGVRDTAAAMFQLFSRLPPHLRWQVTRRGLTRPLPLLRPLFAA